MTIKQQERIAKQNSWKKYINPFKNDPNYDRDEHWHNFKQAKNKEWVCQCYRRFPEIDCEKAFSLADIIDGLAYKVGMENLAKGREER